MFLRNFFTASTLFLFLAAIAAAQSTPMEARQVITGFTPLSEKQLKAGHLRMFDGFSTFGWGGDSRVEGGRLHFTGRFTKETPLWFIYPTTGDYIIVSGWSVGTTLVNPGANTPLFDGETLSGWTIRGNSHAEVVDGAIRLTGGSGSLESEGMYANFVLQLEYYTPVRPEGSGVNSGVFFRCIPGETMNGYECQILNNPSEGDYERFIGTETGGIFRRQVARNVGPKDGEWNYLTIAARGPRVATWVNGIQVTNWTDERAPHNNPRNGLRLEAGTIQFQGHDSETLILFRNIRIKEL